MLEARARLKILAKLAATVSQQQSEWEVAAAVSAGLKEFFAPGVTVELILRRGVTTELASVGDAREASVVLERLRQDGPVSSHHDYDDLTRRLRVPQVLMGDETGGPLLCAPLMNAAAFLGVIVVEGDPGRDDFSLPDLETLCGVAGQVGVVLWYMRRRLTPHRLRLAEDLEQAREVQRRFLPSLPPQVGGLRVATCYRPAYAVGGDFYDLVTTEDGRVTVVIGDVAGNGISAALLMSRIASEFRRLARSGQSPAAIFQGLNAAVEESSLDYGFVTAACVCLDTRRRTAALASAGHLPVLVRREDGSVQMRGLGAGAPLGMLADEVYPEETFAVEGNDLVVLATDGVLATLAGVESPSGMRHLVALLSRAPPDVHEFNRSLLAELTRASGDAHPDDVAAISLQVVSDKPRSLRPPPLV